MQASQKALEGLKAALAEAQEEHGAAQQDWGEKAYLSSGHPAARKAVVNMILRESPLALCSSGVQRDPSTYQGRSGRNFRGEPIVLRSS